MSREIYLGEVLTLLHDRPVKFVARAFDGSGTEDPLDQTPLKYVFNEQGVEQGVKADFTLKVSRAVVMRHEGMITHRTHNTAIRFAIVSKRLSPEDSEFLLTTERLKSQETTQAMSPETLKMEILRFFYTFNKPWPEQGISPWHLLDNFYATQEQVQQWIRFWRKAGFLLQQSSGVRYRENRGQVQSLPDTINPARFDDVERTVRSHETAEPVSGDPVSGSHFTSSKRNRMSTDGALQVNNRDVFVVHGRNFDKVNTVARFLEKLECSPIILREKPNRSQTIIEKVERHSDVGFAVVLLTPDDEGRLCGDESWKLRARQNVIMELGYFMGRIGRDRVACILVETENFEKPSDIDGILYIPLDDKDAWQMKLAKELKDAGYNIDLNKVL